MFYLVLFIELRTVSVYDNSGRSLGNKISDKRLAHEGSA
jgi:hypothetical protein